MTFVPQPNDPYDPFVEPEQWSLEIQVVLQPNRGRVLDIGPSPWIQLDFFEGERAMITAPKWVSQYLWTTEVVAYQSRAWVLEVIEVILDNITTLPNSEEIKQWTYMASVSRFLCVNVVLVLTYLNQNWFNSFVRKNFQAGQHNLTELNKLVQELLLEGKMRSLSL